MGKAKEQAYKQETIWRLTEEDVRMVIEDKFPLLTEEETEEVIKEAYKSFAMYGWEEVVDTFVEVIVDNKWDRG